MRKLVLAFALITMCTGLTGCGTPYQETKSAKNSYDYQTYGYLPVTNSADIDQPLIAEGYEEAIGQKESSPKISVNKNTIEAYPSYKDQYINMSINVAYDQLGKAKGFNLKVHNKSKEDINIVWNDSYFINNMNPDGGFMFDGIKYLDRNNPKQNDLVFPNGILNKNIYPNSMIIYIPYDRYARRLGIPTGWLHKTLTNGNYGVYVHIIGKNYDKKIKLTLNIE